MQKNSLVLGATALLLVGFVGGFSINRSVGAYSLQQTPKPSPTTKPIVTIIDQSPCKPPKIPYTYVNADNQKYVYCVDPDLLNAIDDCMDHSKVDKPEECLAKFAA